VVGIILEYWLFSGDIVIVSYRIAPCMSVRECLCQAPVHVMITRHWTFVVAFRRAFFLVFSPQ
jgi:hypothetical protein